MTDAEIRAAINSLTGLTVDSLDYSSDTVRMTNGTVYSVDYQQNKQIAVRVGSNVIDYVANGDSIEGLAANASYLVSGTEADDSADYTTDSDGTSTATVTVSTSSSDITLVRAYEVELPADVTGETEGGEALAANDTTYVQSGVEVTLTFGAAGYYAVDDDVAYYDVDDTETFTVSDDVEVTYEENYMTEEDIADAIETAAESISTEVSGVCTISIDTDDRTVEIVFEAGQSAGNVSDGSTGLMNLAAGLIAQGNTLRATFEDGTVINITASSKQSLVTALEDNGMPTSVTIVVTNTDSGESVTYTINVSQETGV